jgi:1,4-alpha-glucan branching enzyme
VRDLNRLYTGTPALHRLDAAQEGFDWLVGDDTGNSVFALLRRAGDEQALVVSNLTPVPRHAYRIGVPGPARGWREAVNTDAQVYGGSGTGNGGRVNAQEIASHGHACSVLLTLPPLSTLILLPES